MGNNICFDDINLKWDHCNSFEKSSNYIVNNIDVPDTSDLTLEEQCPLYTGEYISHHLRTAVLFFLYFCFFGLIITIFHEVVVSIMFTHFGYEVQGVSISLISGHTEVIIPEDAPGWWYFLALLGPTILVEGMIVFILVINLKFEYRPVFLDSTITGKKNVRIVKNAMGAFCTIRLFNAIILFPITNTALRFFLGIETTSEIVVAWNAMVYLSGAEAVIWRIMIIFTSAFLFALSGLYINFVRKPSIVS